MHDVILRASTILHVQGIYIIIHHYYHIALRSALMIPNEFCIFLSVFVLTLHFPLFFPYNNSIKLISASGLITVQYFNPISAFPAALLIPDEFCIFLSMFVYVYTLNFPLFFPYNYRWPHGTSKRTELRSTRNFETHGTSKMSSKLLGLRHGLGCGLGYGLVYVLGYWLGYELGSDRNFGSVRQKFCRTFVEFFSIQFHAHLWYTGIKRTDYAILCNKSFRQS